MAKSNNNEKYYEEEDYEKGEEGEDVYKEEDVEEELDEDGIKVSEAGFMEGYDREEGETEDVVANGEIKKTIQKAKRKRR